MSTTTQLEQFNDAVFYVYELINDETVVEYVGVTKHPNKRLFQHTKIKPHKVKPSSTYGMFYGREDIRMEIIVGFDTRKEALKTEGAIKEENGLLWTEQLQFRKEYCSKAAKKAYEGPNHNVKTRFLCANGEVVSGLWLKRYCKANKLDIKKAVRIL